MTKKAKLLERIRNNPKDAKFNEVQQLLKDVGFSERQPKGGSWYPIQGPLGVEKTRCTIEH